MQVRIEPSWARELAGEFAEPYFAQLTDFVRHEYATATVYPPGQRIFAAFDACPFEQVRVVILGQDPYHGYGQANGLCFAVGAGVPYPPSLVNILREVEADTGAPATSGGDLESWARQGVLLLNASLTVRAGQANSHSGHGWEQLTDAVILHLSQHSPHPLVFMLWGSYAGAKRQLIDQTRHLVLTAPHPSPLSAYRGFFGCRHFTRANAWLAQQGLDPIQW